MKSDTLKQLMIEKIRGDITSGDARALEAYFLAHPEARKEMQDLKQTWDFMDIGYTQKLPDDVKRSVLHSLQEHSKYSNLSVISVIWKIAAVVIVATGIGFTAYQYVTTPEFTESISSETIQLISQKNAGSRIQGVFRLAEDHNLAQSEKERLVTLLRNDEDSNVRLAALEVLLQMVDEPNVKMQLIQSIALQNSPQVQLLLIHEILKWNDDSAIPGLKKLLKHPETDGLLKQRINSAIEVLS